MSITTLDPQTAFVVIDLQKGLAVAPTIDPIPAITEKVGVLASAFRRRGLLVVLVNVAGVSNGRTEHGHHSLQFPPDWTDLLPELGQHAEDLVVTKHTWGAFLDTGLESLLKSAGVTQIVLAGVATSLGVESTAREAYALGFNVTLAVDAMTDLTIEAHTNSITRIFPRLGETGTTREILALLDKRGT